jgi:hypothetical protein
MYWCIKFRYVCFLCVLHDHILCKNKVISLLFNWTLCNEGVLGSGGIAPRILDFGSRWRWLVSFTPQPLYPQGKSPWYPLRRRLGGPQSRPGQCGEEKNSQPLPRLEPPYHPACSPALYSNKDTDSAVWVRWGLMSCDVWQEGRFRHGHRNSAETLMAEMC